MNLKQISIFVVDDEQIIAQTLVLILQKSGYSARAFSNPLKALAAARLEAPDLLLSDVVMPQLSGVELAIQLRALCPPAKSSSFQDRPKRQTC